MPKTEHIQQVFIIEKLYQVRSALRLMLVDLQMQVVGEAADWAEASVAAPATHADVLLVHWGLLPPAAAGALTEMHRACPGMRIVVLSGQPGMRRAALSAGADAFISKAEAPNRFSDQLRAAVDNDRQA